MTTLTDARTPRMLLDEMLLMTLGFLRQFGRVAPGVASHAELQTERDEYERCQNGLHAESRAALLANTLRPRQCKPQVCQVCGEWRWRR